jgi:hypothetical protein
MLHLRLAQSVLPFLGACLVACSGTGSSSVGDGGTDTSAPHGDADSHEDGGTSHEAGASDASGSKDSAAPNDSSTTETGGGGSCGPADAAAGKAYVGVVSLGESVLPTPTTYGVIATFHATPPTPECSGTLTGVCCYNPPGSTTTTPVYAGKITVDDGTTTIATLTPPDYVAASEEEASVKWAPGDTIKVTAAGGKVDAFSISGKAPARIAGLTPSFSTTVAVTLSKDLVVSWTPNGDSCTKISFGLNQKTTAPASYIGCVVDDSAGTLTVPHSLLSKFTATTGTAVMERAETLETTASNAAAGLAITVVMQAPTTYSK